MRAGSRGAAFCDGPGCCVLQSFLRFGLRFGVVVFGCLLPCRGILFFYVTASWPDCTAHLRTNKSRKLRSRKFRTNAFPVMCPVLKFLGPRSRNLLPKCGDK